MPEDNNLDNYSISEILDLYKDTLDSSDDVLSSLCSNFSKSVGANPGVGMRTVAWKNIDFLYSKYRADVIKNILFL